MSDIKYMNFVYNSEESYSLIVLNHIRYVWGDIDIRDYLSEDTIQNAEDIVIASNGGSLRVLHHDKIPMRRKYQVVSEFTKSKDIKSKYILICPNHMQWSFDELTSEGELEVGEKYIEIAGTNLNEMEILNLASNLSYMYGIRFVPHTVKEKKLYRISLDDNKVNVWKDISDNTKSIQKAYKLDSVYIESVKKKRKPNENKLEVNQFGWEW